jgi:hypothetical protein
MSIVAIIASCAAACVTVAVVVLLMRHADKAPQKAHPWIRRLNIALMWCAGAVFAASGLENFIGGLTADATGFIGAAYAPLITTIIVIAALVITTGVIIALIWAPDDQAAFTALAVPLVLGLVAGGALHSLYLLAVSPGQSVTAAISAWLAG